MEKSANLNPTSLYPSGAQDSQGLWTTDLGVLEEAVLGTASDCTFNFAGVCTLF